jgi:VWFA-related protein
MAVGAGLLSVLAQNVPTFRAGIALVHVDAEVLGERSPVAGLHKDDFHILDGQEQRIVAFSEGEEPLDLMLLFDISSSMRMQAKEFATAAHEALRELRVGDQVSVTVFNQEPVPVAPFSKDLGEVEWAIRRVQSLGFGGGTRIQGAVHYAARQFRYLDYRERRRRAVLVITDNLGTPAHNRNEIVEQLWEADALVCGLVTPNRITPYGLFGPIERARHGGIEEFVEQTGGDIIRSRDVKTSFPEMMHRIRSRYTMYYQLPEAQIGSLRTVQVQLSDRAQQRFPAARVLARRGYRVQQYDRYGFVVR